MENCLLVILGHAQHLSLGWTFLLPGRGIGNKRHTKNTYVQMVPCVMFFDTSVSACNEIYNVNCSDLIGYADANHIDVHISHCKLWGVRSVYTERVIH